MDGVSKSSFPFAVRSSDGTELVIPDEFIHILSIMVSVRLVCAGVQILKNFCLEDYEKVS